MIRSSPFMAQAPVLAAQPTHAVQEWYDLGFHAAETAMVVFGYPNDRFHHIWEAAATAAALLEGVIHLRGHDELPGIVVEQIEDRLLDLLLRDQIAMTDNHASTRLCRLFPGLAEGGGNVERLEVAGESARLMARAGRRQEECRRRQQRRGRERRG